MSFRVKDTLLFAIILLVFALFVDEMTPWLHFAACWALGRWLAVLLEEWDEEGE